MEQKIAVVTMFGNNYGACLQAYALQVFLNWHGYSVQQLQYSNGANSSKSILAKMKAVGLTGVFRFLASRGFSKGLKSVFNDFRTTFLHLSERIYDKSSLQAANKEYDAFVCGSDMIWSEEFYDDWYFYYLGFADRERSIAYAASFGKNDVSSNKRSECGSLLSEIAHLSTRESGGAELIHSLNGRSDSCHVCDPTLLLSYADWNSLLCDGKNGGEECGYCLYYVFGGVGGARRAVLDQLSDSDLKNIFIPNSYDEYRRNGKKVATVLDFVRLFRDSSFVITDTFHGMLFAVIFRKPFVVLRREQKEHWGRYSDRITGFLDYFGLTDRYCSPKDFDYNSFKELDYSLIEEKIYRFVESSKTYLLTSLEEALKK